MRNIKDIKKKQKKIAVAVTAVIAVVLALVFLGQKEFHYAGTLEITKVTLSSKLATDILYFPYEEGDSVVAGETVVKLNDDVYQVASRQLNNDFRRAVELRKKGHTSEDQYDRIERMKRENDLKIDWSNLKAPISGVIITKFKEAGEYVAPGVPVVSLANTKDIWAYFYVEHDKINTLRVGDKVKGRLPEVPNRVFNGKIIKINEESEFTPKNVQTRAERTRLVYGVKVKFDNDDLTLKAGMTVETDFE